MPRPVLYVLAGVNGAGKSSIGGHLLEQKGLTWFNPDTFARELVALSGCDQATANAQAWPKACVGWMRPSHADTVMPSRPLSVGAPWPHASKLLLEPTT
jgi:predicted ABC-type ATPase